ncbi:phage terminase small subunit P27 family [Anaerocolumna aminovalerica]|uniref:phage terminase small subunit P27 family n=1 Tax=Anaerocolumna aminovalerica TaxID=1527 RepID=UPI001C0E99FF|nr:phage terminase small subunit P27 family [Anaerocolumna aminovalerica]MBU5331423.1 phage terminase small subunit P27 family [Anaerocolumna aminovalerica]
MARQRKPVDMQKGNLTVLQQEKKRLEEEYVRTGKNQLKTPPIWLIDDIAKKEFKRIVKELEKIDIIGNLDLNNLGAYCNAFSHYIHVTEQLNGQDYYIARETRTGVIFVKNPLIDIQTNYANEMRKFASLCGMTIDSRLKAATTKVNKQQEEINKKFGGI